MIKEKGFQLKQRQFMMDNIKKCIPNILRQILMS